MPEQKGTSKLRLVADVEVIKTPSGEVARGSDGRARVVNLFTGKEVLDRGATAWWKKK